MKANDTFSKKNRTFTKEGIVYGFHNYIIASIDKMVVYQTVPFNGTNYRIGIKRFQEWVNQGEVIFN